MAGEGSADRRDEGMGSGLTGMPAGEQGGGRGSTHHPPILIHFMLNFVSC